MISTTPAPGNVEPFTFVRPQLPAPPFKDGAELEANRDTLLPAAQAYTAAEEILQRATDEADRIAKDPHWSEQGKKDAFAKLAMKELPALRDHRAKLDAADANLKARAEEMQKAAAPPDPTDRDERLAEAFGRKTEAQRRTLLEGAITGKDIPLAKALYAAHPILHGLGPDVVNILRDQVLGANLDAEAVEQLKDQAFKLGRVRLAVTSAIDAIEKASDRTQLMEAGLTTLRRSDLDVTAKVAFIDQHGLAAFQKLPD